jgi:transposase-like protein
MHARGAGGREIKGRLEETYGIEAPPGLTSRVTGAVSGGARERQNRPLEKPYAAAYLGALRVKGKRGGESRLKSVRAKARIRPRLSILKGD